MFQKRYIEWDVPLSQVQIDVPVGYEVELSLYRDFNPVSYRLTTYEEDIHSIASFYYSLDNGETWISFPTGDSGMAFDSAYRMRLAVNEAQANHIFALSNNGIYQIRPDGTKSIKLHSINEVENISDIAINDDLLLLRNGKMLYQYTRDNYTLKPKNWSVNLIDNPLAVEYDNSRKTIWQINDDKVCLKNMFGENIFCTGTPFKLDYEASSSSSSSSEGYSSSSSFSSSTSSQSSSSSSYGYSSSSSSSSEGYSSSSSSSSLGYSSSSSSSSKGYSSSSSSSSSSSEGYSSSSSSSSSSLSSSSSSSSLGSSSSSSYNISPLGLSSLEAYWKMEETSGTRYDSVNSHDLTEYGSITGSTIGAKNNKGALWPSSPFAPKLETPRSGLTPSSSIIISTWVNLPLTRPTQKPPIISAAFSVGEYSIYWMWDATNDYIQFSMYYDDETVIVDSNSISKGLHHITAIATTTSISVYIDGELHSRNTFGAKTFVNDGSTYLAIGNVDEDPGSYFEAPFSNGTVDEVGIWIDETIPDAEWEREFVEKLYNDGIGLFYS